MAASLLGNLPTVDITESAPRTPDPIAATLVALRRVVVASERYRLRLARRSLGVGATEMVALAGLAMDGPRTPTQIADRLQITSASVTELLDRLERASLVARRPHDTDRRKVVVDLTDRGREAMNDVISRFTDAIAVGAAGFTEAEHDLVIRFLLATAAELDQIT